MKQHSTFQLGKPKEALLKRAFIQVWTRYANSKPQKRIHHPEVYPLVPGLKGKSEEHSFQRPGGRATLVRAVVFRRGAGPCRGAPDLTLPSPSDLLLRLSIIKPKSKPEVKRAHCGVRSRSASMGREQGGQRQRVGLEKKEKDMLQRDSN